jgi:hypothetical protein
MSALGRLVHLGPSTAADRSTNQLHAFWNNECKTGKLIAKYDKREPVDSLLDQSKNFLYYFTESKVLKGTELLRL